MKVLYKVCKTPLHLGTGRVHIAIYNEELCNTPFYCASCDAVSMRLAIIILKSHGVNLKKLAKLYYNRKNKRQGWLDVTQKLKFADKIIVVDAHTGEVLLNIRDKSQK